MLMTGTPRNAAASALEMTVSTAISQGNLTAISLPVANKDDKLEDLPASDIWDDSGAGPKRQQGLSFLSTSTRALHWKERVAYVCIHTLSHTQAS